MTVFTKGGTALTIPLPGETSYWAAKLKDPDEWVCERDVGDARAVKWVTQEEHAGSARRPIDQIIAPRPMSWSLDIVGSGDWQRITELWLFCPMSPTSPAGNTARLPITTPGTAFELHVKTVDSNLVQSVHSLQAQIIGRVMDSTGECECFIYDDTLEGMIALWRSNVYHFGTWRPPIPGKPAIAPLGPLNLKVLGIHLPERA